MRKRPGLEDAPWWMIALAAIGAVLLAARLGEPTSYSLAVKPDTVAGERLVVQERRLWGMQTVEHPIEIVDGDWMYERSGKWRSLDGVRLSQAELRIPPDQALPHGD